MMTILDLQTNSLSISQSDSLIQGRVLTVNWGNGGKFGKRIKIKFADINDAAVIHVPRSACITKGDVVYRYNPINDESSMEKTHLFVECENGLAQITPIYSENINIQIGKLNIPITIKEISSQEEFDGYSILTQHHYRDKSLFGRHAPLVAVSHHTLLPKVIGYIDLATAFFVNTPRRNIVDEPTRINGVSWEGWTKDVIRSRIPLFVRIARCVVHPELRSMGIGKILVEHAANFAINHWQSAHWKPYFLEISADMLRFIPFASRAGMTYVGETEGNLNRIVKDLRYLNANEKRLQKEIFTGEVIGILDTKLSQLQKAKIAVNDLEEQNIGDFIAQQLREPTLDGWAKLAGVLSLPKPHYMMGLNEETMNIISNRAKNKNIPQEPAQDSIVYIEKKYKTKLHQPIILKDVSFEVEISVKRTNVTHQIERAFEISLDNLKQPILRKLNLEILPGEIVLITGLSGTGKTSLLNLLGGNSSPTGGEIILPKKTKMEKLAPIQSDKPLIEVIGKADTGEGIYWLGVVGLSEPHLYVKPFSALSAGQKYRAMLAQLLIQGSNLWLIDEFCENLDIVNTNLLAQKISSLARRIGTTIVVASSDATRFVKSLCPDKVVILKGAIDTNGYQTLTCNQFINQMDL